jgi:hypothetical protein
VPIDDESVLAVDYNPALWIFMVLASVLIVRGTLIMVRALMAASVALAILSSALVSRAQTWR